MFKEYIYGLSDKKLALLEKITNFASIAGGVFLAFGIFFTELLIFYIPVAIRLPLVVFSIMSFYWSYRVELEQKSRIYKSQYSMSNKKPIFLISSKGKTKAQLKKEAKAAMNKYFESKQK